MGAVGKIVFYEDKNFQGHYFECNSDFPELNTHFRRCNSVQVERGAWVLNERPNYLGYQYILTKGDYPDYQRWMGYNDSVRSCRIIRNTSGVFKIRVYERPDFSGQMLERTEDLRDLADHWHRHEVQSAQVLDGVWVFYEQPNFQGQQYLLEKGEYRRFPEWAAMNPKVGSFRSVV